MRDILLLCFSQIRKKKRQNFIITLILCLSIFLFITAVTVVNNNKNLYMRLHQQLNGAHQILQLQDGIYNSDEFMNWWNHHEGVTTSGLMPYQTISKISTEDNVELLNYTAYMMKTPQIPFTIDKLIMTDGTERSNPPEGCIWIPTAFALSKNVSVGDSLKFVFGNNTFQLKVAAIVIDISYCAPFSTNGRFWMNQKDYDRFFSASTINPVMISLRFDHYEDNQTYWDRFEKDFHQPYLESITEFESLSSFYFVTNNLISFIMLFIAVLMLFIAIFSIEHILSDTILTNYRAIGIIKSMGFSSKKTMLIYVIQYVLLSLAALLPSLIFSYYLSRTIVMNAFQYLSSSQLATQFEFTSYAVLIAFIMPIFIALMIVLFTRKATKIQPVQAIRYGMDEKEASKLSKRLANSNRKHFDFGKLPLTLQIALRFTVRNRQSTWIIGLITAITISVLVFCSIFFTSITHLTDSISKWGYDSSDIVIKSINLNKIDPQMLSKILDQNSEVKSYSFYTDANAIIERSADVPPMGLVISIVNGNYDEIGYTNLKGHNPMSKNEIAIGVNLANKYHKTIGDSVSFYIKGEKLTFTITGIYQAIANMAFSARITSDALSVFPEQLCYDNVFINLNNPKNHDIFTKDFNKMFDGALQSISSQELVKGVISEAISVISIPVIIMECIFLLVIFVLLYSIGSIMTKKHQMTYGIYKSLGMTSLKIRKSIAISTFTISLIAMWVGILVGTFLIPKLLNIVLSQYGIIKMPLYINILGIVGIGFIGVLCATLGSYASSKSIKKSSPRILIVE